MISKFYLFQKTKVILAFGYLLFSGTAQAEACSVSSPMEMLEALLERNPAIKAAQTQLKAQGDLFSAANVLPNPEVEYAFKNSDSIEGDILSNEVSLGFVVELGGKRGARKALALAEKDVSSVALEAIRLGELSRTIVNWFKYKEGKAAINLYGSAVKLFETYLRSISRRSLSPSQEVERKTIGLAIMDIRLLLVQATSKQSDLKKHLYLALDSKCELDPSVFDAQISLPNKIEKQELSKESVAMKEFDSHLKQFEASLAKSRSESYPDIVLGPTFGVDQSLYGNELSYGVKVSMALPIFNLGRSARRASSTLLEAHEILENSRARDMEVDLQTLIEKYNSLSKVLQSFPSSADLVRDFSGTARQFQRGVISSSLFLESQRKYIGFLEGKTEVKVDAIEALLSVYKSTNQNPMDLFKGESK